MMEPSQSLITQGYVTYPRAIVIINETQINFVELNINTTTFYSSDDYEIEIPLKGQPTPFTLDYWSNVESVFVKIYIGFPENKDSFSTADLELMISGESNEIFVDPIMQTIRLSGRDLTSRFIDKKLTQTFSNNTASEVVTFFAIENGLKPEVTKTSTIIGTYTQTQQTFLTNNTTQWDFLTYLATQENFALFVEGESLIFKPRPTQENSTPYILKYVPEDSKNLYPSINCTRISLIRSTSLIGNISVTIKVPYSTKTGSDFSVKVKSSYNSRFKGKNSNTKKYVYVYPGLSKEQATQKANEILQNLMMHQTRISFEMPGENSIKKDGLIKLEGTNTSYDQIYYPDHISRKFSMPESYDIFVDAKNKSQNTTDDTQ